ncbi:hypothetical protein [Tenacibaculum sp.]|uniref:hypothetical protein n=1 Tax=Tenacibaculum sp. TaxID=1906242 RepID=UPI003D124D1C
MDLIKEQKTSEGRKQRIIFFLAETNSINPRQDETELSITIQNGNEQIDFDFSLSETDEIIGFLKGLRKNIIQRDSIKRA